MTDLITYAGSVDRIDIAVKFGADRIIIDDPAVSCRSYQSPETEKLQSLVRLLDYCYTQYKHIKISVNLDAVLHMHQVPLINRVLDILANHSKDSLLHVHDYGIMYHTALHYPNQAVCISPEMGQVNALAIQALSGYASQYTLPVELSYHVIKQLLASSSGTSLAYNLLVHGPVLIQYSYRQYYHNILNKTDTLITGYSDDADYPGRLYPILENQHGHFMYFYMDRCLRSVTDLLKPLHLSGWIVDGRGQSDAYLSTALQAYRSVLDNQSDTTDRCADSVQQAMAAVSPRPLKPLFFIANITEQPRGDRPYPANLRCIGHIINIESKTIMQAELCETVHHLDNLSIYVPQSPKSINKPPQYYKQAINLCDISNQVISVGEPGDIIQLPWLKGSCVNAKVLQPI